MLWSKRLAAAFGWLLAFASLSGAATPDNPALWQEFGLVAQRTDHVGRSTVTAYQMKDPTGAIAAWEWLRSPAAKSCGLMPFCTEEGSRTTVVSANYVLQLEGAPPTKAQLEQYVRQLPNVRDTSLPAILTFIPKEGRLANSARYVLGPESLKAFAPEMVGLKPDFDAGAEAQVAAYQVAKNAGPLRLAVFAYPTPEMARVHLPDFKAHAGSHVKRSGVLVAAVLGQVPDAAADTLLSRVSYEAKITWNETPPPSPIKPLYRLLVDILYISALVCILALGAGLAYAAIRVYRRRYGNLDDQESMTVLHLTE